MKLTKPLQIKNLMLKNRIVMPPMATSKSKDGSVNDALIAYYDEKSKDQSLGMIIQEHAYISPEGRANPGQVSLADDQQIPGLARLTEAVHQNNTPIIAQISHAGNKAKPESGFGVYGPDALEPLNASQLPVQALTKQQIQKIVLQFGDAAQRAKKAGYDGVEIHAAHAYLLDQFYSPLTNTRTDEYNGSTLEGRTRLIREVIREVRSRVGDNYPVFLRLGISDYHPGGASIEDSVQAAKWFEQDGIDLLDISGGLCYYVNPYDKNPGYFSDASSAIRQNVSIPVLLTGGITEAKQAEQLLEEEKADLIGVGRAILRDSHWAKKALEQLD